VSSERGSAAVLVCVCVSILLTLGVGLGAVGGLLRAHRTAQAAADLAALAGAQTQQHGGPACVTAADLARANGAALVDCQLLGDVVTVEVQAAGPHWLGLDADPIAKARAGPG
jgi:secretion/DNA translocation related TadE-like protein